MDKILTINNVTTEMEEVRVHTSKTEKLEMNITNHVSVMRIVGVVALAYAASMIMQNTLFAVTGAPDYGDPMSEVLAYHAENTGALAITSGLEVANMLLLLLFVSSLHGLVQRRGGAGGDWSRLALVAGVTLATLFALTIATHIVVALAADGLTGPTPVFELIWQLHTATFALALPALGITFIGVTLATHASGLIRPWQQLLGIVGGSLPILAGLGNLAIVDGSPVVFIGVFGLFIWIVWLIVTGLRFIRG